MENKKYLIKEKDGKFLVIKDGNKRYSKIFTTMIDAGDWVLAQGAELIIENTECNCSECETQSECNCGDCGDYSIDKNVVIKQKKGISYGYESSCGSYALAPQPTFKEKIQGFFNRLFK